MTGESVMSASVQIDGRRTQTGHRRYNGEHTIYGAGEVIHVITIQSSRTHARERTTVAGQWGPLVNTPASIGPQLAHKWLHHGS